MSTVGTALFLSGGLGAIAVTCYAISAMAKSRSLPPNGMIGIQTRATRHSDASWIAGHDAARPVMITTSVVASGGAVAAVLTGIALRSQQAGDGAIAVLGISAYTIVLGLLTFAAIRANQAARKVE